MTVKQLPPELSRTKKLCELTSTELVHFTHAELAAWADKEIAEKLEELRKQIEEGG